MALDNAALTSRSNAWIKDLGMYAINLRLLEIQENQILADLRKLES